MGSAARGGGTSQVEVSGISAHGVWLFLGDEELFLSFKDFPWFRDAPVAGVLNVERPQPQHLYWPDLDVDLHVDSIRDPTAYPLVSGSRPNKRPRTASGTKPAARKRSASRSRRG